MQDKMRFFLAQISESCKAYCELSIQHCAVTPQPAPALPCCSPAGPYAGQRPVPQPSRALTSPDLSRRNLIPFEANEICGGLGNVQGSEHRIPML